MDNLQVGDIVSYKNDHIQDGKWFLHSLRSGNLCTIIRIRNGSIYNEKNGEKRLNASIVNLNISEIKKRG